MAKKLVKVDGKCVCYSEPFYLLVDNADQATDFTDFNEESDNYSNCPLIPVLSSAIKNGGKVEVVFQPDVNVEYMDETSIDRLKLYDTILDAFQWYVLSISDTEVKLLSKYTLGTLQYSAPIYDAGYVQYGLDWGRSLIKEFCDKNRNNIMTSFLSQFIKEFRIPKTSELLDVPDYVLRARTTLFELPDVRTYWVLDDNEENVAMINIFGKSVPACSLCESKAFRPLVVLDIEAMPYLVDNIVDQPD